MEQERLIKGGVTKETQSTEDKGGRARVVLHSMVCETLKLCGKSLRVRCIEGCRKI